MRVPASIPPNPQPTATTRVYTTYDVNNPPAYPGPGWTRFVCLSDTHSETCKVPVGDVLLHAGDLSSWGYIRNLEVTVSWLASLPHPVKMYVAMSLVAS